MTIDRASVEEGLRLAGSDWETVEDELRYEEIACGTWPDLARELQRLWRVEKAAREVDAEHQDGRASFRTYKRLRAALANPAAEEGE